jgi:polyisoprenoid-binding protein YceI
MPAPSGQITGPALWALLADGTLAGEWALDPTRSSVRLRSKSLGVIRVSGVFREVSGHGTVSADGKVSGTLAVATASIDTRNTRRDKHLRSAEIFDSDSHPRITFTANGIRPSGQAVAVTGALTVRGRTQPLPFNAEASVHGSGEIWLDAEAVVNRTDFGLRWKADGPISATSTVTIHAVFTRL